MLRRAILLLLFFALAACSVRETTTLEERYRRHALHQQQLAAVQSWQIVGRVAFSNETTSTTARVFWHGAPERISLKLVAPLGYGAVAVESDSSGATLTDSQGQVHYAATPEALIELKTGWRIPVSKMYTWVLGRSLEVGSASVQLDSAGLVQSFADGGWRVDYLAYTNVTLGQEVISLPRKISLQSDHLKIKLVISQWHIS